MAKFWIYNNEIAGLADEGIGLPSGFTLADGPDLPTDFLYYDGDTIQEKPSQPSELHKWDLVTHRWILPQTEQQINASNNPPSLEETIANAQQDCLNYWAERIAALTVDYPDTEVATWLDFKREADAFLESHDLDDAPNLYRETMLRLFGPEATVDFCNEFRADNGDDAIGLVEEFANHILQKNADLLPELTRLKGLRGYHWEQLKKLDSVEAVQEYDYRREG